jgi:hypothetical protein
VAYDSPCGRRADEDACAARLFSLLSRRSRLDLRCVRGLHSDIARGLFEPRGRRTLFERELQTALFVQQLLALATQAFGLVPILDGQILLSHGVDETGGQHQTTREQKHLAPRRAWVAHATKVGVGLLLGHSSHLLLSLRTSVSV